MARNSATWARSKFEEGASAAESHSVTDIGEPALVRASSLEIARGAVLAGRYQVEAVIGRGGSGIVLRAFDRVAQVPVAIKILKPDLASDPHWVERFSRELRLARRIQHPNVCRVFDIGEADGHWFITMELAPGGTLRDQLGEHAHARTAAERIADVHAVAAGLAVIHAAGIVHRDVKPDNFLRMCDGRLVLSDFGLATNPSDAPTVSILVGTPFYMAPEIVMGEPASAPSDVWAAGVVIHEILLGVRPDRTTPMETSISKPGKDATAVERNLLQLSRGCLAERCADRPPDGTALLKLVEDAIAGTSRKTVVRGKSPRSTAWGWGAIALATLALVAVFNRRLWPSAAATAAKQSAASRIATAGSPEDWSVGAHRLAEFDGSVHCFSILPRGQIGDETGHEMARVVWGSPRKAEEVDLSTGARVPSSLPPETYATDCPQLSADGKQLLFTRQPDKSLPQIILADPDGTNGRVVTTGAEPLWMPSGQEFLFDLDVSHVGVFSLPTMSYSLVGDERGQSPRVLYKKAVSPRGDLLAVIYNSDTTQSRAFEMHSVPDLAAVATWTMPFSVHDVSFVGDQLFLSDIDQGGTFERLDWRTGQADRVGRLPDRMIRSVSALPDGSSIALSSTQLSDAWLFEPGKQPFRITSDGQTYSASWSPSGDVLLGRSLDDGRFVIVRRDRAGVETQVTEGPSDSLPSFSSDGTQWVYSAYDRKAIIRCQGTTCSEVLRGHQMPTWPTLSPGAASVAFVTEYGAPRLHLVDADGKNERDLGPTATECPPVWTGPQSLWAFGGAGLRREWLEIDARTGVRTGRSRPALTFNPDERQCGWESETPTSAFYQRVRIIPRDTWAVSAQPRRNPSL